MGRTFRRADSVYSDSRRAREEKKKERKLQKQIGKAEKKNDRGTLETYGESK